MRHERKKNFVYISIELKKLTLATLAFQTEEEEDEDMKMSHEKKKLRVYISLRRQTLWIMYIYYLFFKYEGGSNFKSNTPVLIYII